MVETFGLKKKQYGRTSWVLFFLKDILFSDVIHLFVT